MGRASCSSDDGNIFRSLGGLDPPSGRRSSHTAMKRHASSPSAAHAKKNAKSTLTTKRATAERLDTLHDAGGNLSAYMDTVRATRPGRVTQRVNVGCMQTASTFTRFRTQAEFRAWLKTHHRTETSLVLQLVKTHAKADGITYAQALDEALCFGWIDGIRRACDARSFTVRVAPRKRRSIWSLVNVRHVERLIAAKRMAAPGLAAFHARDEKRTDIYAFEQAAAKLDRAATALFKKNAKAWKYFQTEAPWYRRTATRWVTSARKDETRQKRLATLIACSAKGERIGPLKRP
jgi:uncharacterized protein YdeI (YjbR/CyaY-like superfamily)